jgi:hypothetical protein
LILLDIMKKYCTGRLLKNLLVSISVLAFLPFEIMAEPPPGAPTDKDPGAYKGLSPEDVTRLKKGELVIIKDVSGDQGTTKGMIKAAIMFNQPLDKVWDLMTQGWRQEEYLPYLDRSILIKKLPDGDIIENQVKVLFVPVHFWVRGYHYHDRFYVDWTLAQGYDNGMKRLEGFWQYYYVDDNHTLARYGTLTETGFGVPAFVQEFLTKRDLPESLGRQKAWVDSGGTYRKPGYKPTPK